MHAEWTSGAVAGFIHIAKGSQHSAKRETELIENVLLWVADESNRWPREKRRSGASRHLEGALDDHLAVRVEFKGYEPLLGVQPARSIVRPKQVQIRDYQGGKGDITASD